MKIVKNESFQGERAEFKSKDAKYENCLFHDGESPLKESINIEAKGCTFDWKYPLWYGKNHKIDNCLFTINGRAGIWYTNDSIFANSCCEAPKCFRKCRGLTLENVAFPNGAETLWWNEDVTLSYITAKGDYICMKCKNITVDRLRLDGNYSFDGCENLTIRNSYLKTKDAFWNCKKVYVENSTIIGEYFGWNSEDITLVNCDISSIQGFCYIKKLKMVNCRCVDTNLSFEYCEDIDVELDSHIDSIKNPISGIIRAKSVGEIIEDDDSIDHGKTRIIIDGKQVR